MATLVLGLCFWVIFSGSVWGFVDYVASTPQTVGVGVVGLDWSIEAAGAMHRVPSHRGGIQLVGVC